MLRLLLAALWTANSVLAGVSLDGFAGSNNLTTLPITVGQARRLCSSGAPGLPILEATIASTLQALLQGQLNCSDLVATYVERIHDDDKRGGINAVRVINPNITAQALEKDAQLAQVRALGGNASSLPPLFCVPVLVKDNFDTVGMAATNGASALLDNLPAADATLVRKLKEAGALVLGKSNMAEWAFSPLISVGSAFGVVRNPYNLDRVTAGSSGGSAAGVSANLALVLTSRAGMIPLDVTSDIGGPITRTVEDAARVLSVLQGSDPADALTQGVPKPPDNYSQFLQTDGLKGMKVGVLRLIIPKETADPEFMHLFESALKDMEQAGATIVDNFLVKGNAPGRPDWGGAGPLVHGLRSRGKVGGTFACRCPASARHQPSTSRLQALATSLSRVGISMPKLQHFDSLIRTTCLTAVARQRGQASNWVDGALLGLRVFFAGSWCYFEVLGLFWGLLEVVREEAYHPLSNSSMQWRVAFQPQPDDYPSAVQRQQGYVCTCTDLEQNPCRAEFRKRLIESMDAAKVDVLVFPTWVNPPRLVGDYISADGNLSPQVAPTTGAPAMVVPMGLSRAGLPASLQMVARPFAEGTLLKAAYAYEQATRHRTAPPLYGECVASSSFKPVDPIDVKPTLSLASTRSDSG
eukprot:jgi/Botrbrau1/15887/Bobra.40_1s0070.1